MKKVVLNPNTSRDIELRCTKKVYNFLDKNGVDAVLPNTIEGAELTNIPLVDFDDAARDADMIISLGGDGTLLHTANQVAHLGVPVLGINIGRIGYMAELEANELEYLSRILRGDYKVEERMMLDVIVHRNGDVVYKQTGLNDAVILKTGLLWTVDMDIYADDMFISHYSGDGVIVATPTGSTAYSLSAGGPIIDPLSRNITITPVCTHALSAKPVILSYKRVINVVPQSRENGAIAVSVDGAPGFNLMEGDKLTLKKSELVTKLIRVKKTNFYDVLYTKLSDRRFD